jgi:hypothetical protein
VEFDVMLLTCPTNQEPHDLHLFERFQLNGSRATGTTEAPNSKPRHHNKTASSAAQQTSPSSSTTNSQRAVTDHSLIPSERTWLIFQKPSA